MRTLDGREGKTSKDRDVEGTLRKTTVHCYDESAGGAEDI